ncbi:MAG: elongation factor P [Acidimicrobiaceae bacterium]|nr:elongation factor P [Acidimicrobiaceae bacterium]
MPRITTNELKNGITLKLEATLFNVLKFQHVKPGKGPAFVRTTLRNVNTGAVLDRTFRAGEKVERVNIDKCDMLLLYREGKNFVFMDNNSYEQIVATPETVGDAADFLLDGSEVVVLRCEGEIIGVDLGASVELTVAATDPGVQGDRVSGGTKPATLDTGLTVLVPLFISPGEKIKVDTRTGEYISRA